MVKKRLNVAVVVALIFKLKMTKRGNVVFIMIQILIVHFFSHTINSYTHDVLDSEGDIKSNGDKKGQLNPTAAVPSKSGRGRASKGKKFFSKRYGFQKNKPATAEPDKKVETQHQTTFMINSKTSIPINRGKTSGFKNAMKATRKFSNHFPTVLHKKSHSAKKLKFAHGNNIATKKGRPFKTHSVHRPFVTTKSKLVEKSSMSNHSWQKYGNSQEKLKSEKENIWMVRQNVKRIDPVSHHFPVILMVLIVISLIFYGLYHNRQKIIILIIERRNSDNRPSSKRYKKLEDAMPSFKKAIS